MSVVGGLVTAAIVFVGFAMMSAGVSSLLFTHAACH